MVVQVRHELEAIMMAELAAFWPAGAGLPYLALSDEQAAGDHPVPDNAS